MQGFPPLKGATASDIASYNRHWTKVMVTSKYDGADCVFTSDARSYLATEVAHSHAVDRVLSYLGATETTKRETFEQALHLLYLAVRSAQEVMFSTDDPTLWSDAAPSSSGKLRENEDKQQEWVIGTVAAAQGLTHDEYEDEDDQEEWSALAAGHAPANVHQGDAPLRQSPASSEAAFSIGAATSKSGGSHDRNNSNVEWSAFDAAFSNLNVNDNQDAAEETPQHAPPAWGQHRRQISLAGATAKLSNTVPGTALLGLSPGERQRYEDAFKAKVSGEINYYVMNQDEI